MEALEGHKRRPRMRTGEAAAYLGLSQASLEKHRVKGTGPTYYKLGQIVIYSPEDLDEWADQFGYRSTSGYTARPKAEKTRKTESQKSAASPESVTR